MLKYSHRRYFCLALWIFIGVTNYSSPQRLLAQQAPLDEAMKKWREYQVFSRSLQGKLHYQSTNMITGKTKSFFVDYKQNQNCAMICSSYGKDAGGESCMMSNPNYSAEIQINRINPSAAVLRAYEQETAAVLPSAAMPLSDQLFTEISPHFTYCRARLSDVISRSSFHVEKISKEILSGHEFVRVDHNYIYDWDPPSAKNGRQSHVKGAIYLDPSHCWCIKRIQKTEKLLGNGVEESIAENDIQYETTDHPSGFPILKTQTWDVTGYSQRLKKEFRTKHRYDYELEVKDNLPDADFMLSAFGLPEPFGISVKKSVPAYIWILVAAGVCAAFAFGFRYLARRKRLETTA